MGVGGVSRKNDAPKSRTAAARHLGQMKAAFDLAFLWNLVNIFISLDNVPTQYIYQE